MIPGKEYLMILEDYQKLQSQIWNDSCDYGLKNPSPKAKGSIRHALAELMKIYKCKVECWGAAHKQSKSFTMFMPIEKEGDGYNGIAVALTYEPMMRKDVREYIHICTHQAHSTADVNLHYI